MRREIENNAINSSHYFVWWRGEVTNCLEARKQIVKKRAGS
jgi:hypothetical protein